jgi:glutathione S-transferase
VVEALLARETGNDAALAAATATFHRHAGVVERALDENSGHLIGDSLTAADLVIGSVVTWATSVGLLEPSAKVAEYARKVAGALG